MKNVLLFILVGVLCVSLAGCGNNVVSYSIEDVNAEMERTDDVLEKISDCVSQMKVSFDEASKDKLEGLLEEMEFFGFTEEFQVPKTAVDKVERQLSKIDDCKEKALAVYEEYDSFDDWAL